MKTHNYSNKFRCKTYTPIKEVLLEMVHSKKKKIKKGSLESAEDCIFNTGIPQEVISNLGIKCMIQISFSYSVVFK